MRARIMDCCRPEASYDVDVNSMERAYRQLQARLHPDKYASGTQVWR